jgi:threonine-phosphate decarboxylase
VAIPRALPHGGNIAFYSRKYGIPEKDILDFSASVNPLGPPASALKALKGSSAEIERYPDPDATELCLAIGLAHGIPADNILVGNGSTELIYLLPRALRPKKALVLAPSFSDYARACTLAGCRLAQFALWERDGFLPDTNRLAKAIAKADIAFICNPNNPTGALIERPEMLKLVRAAKKAGTRLVIDEAFIEYAPGASVLPEAIKAGAVVLRNFTKFYGMPGLRVGWLAADKKTVAALDAAKEPWSVGGPAMKAAGAALADDGYREKSLSLMEREKVFLLTDLKGMPGIKPFAPSVNFILARIEDGRPGADALAERLASRGILIRSCSNFSGMDGSFVRFSVRTRSQNRKLVQALREELS